MAHTDVHTNEINEMEQQQAYQLPAAQGVGGQALAVFGSAQGFELAQRQAKALATSTLVPADYRGNVGNCLIAVEIAQRTGSGIMAVMQNLHVIHGRPSWSSSFIIAALNTCGRFSPLRFDVRHDDKGAPVSCRAWAYEKATDDRLDGPEVTMAMAHAEGWVSRNGSKWKTMPELMLRYRAAAFFGRLYAPDVLMGMHTDDEVIDVYAGPDGTYKAAQPASAADAAPGNDNDPIAAINATIAQQENQDTAPADAGGAVEVAADDDDGQII